MDTTDFEEVAENATQLEDGPSAALDIIDEQLEKMLSVDDNKPEGETLEGEKTPELEQLRELVDKQNETISRLVGQMEKMVMAYGARVGDGTLADERAESFKTLKVEDVPETTPAADDIPNLNDIQLGS